MRLERCFPILFVVVSSLTAGGAEDILWYDQPAEKWLEALPVGNGRLGAMVHGGTTTEHIQLNEESLWAGRPAEGIAEHFSEHLGKVQELVLADKPKQAYEYGLKHLTARPTSFRSYEPLGDLFLEFEQPVEATDAYRRELLLRDAVATTTWQSGENIISREVFASAPADIIAVRITGSQPESLDFAIRLSRQKDAEVIVRDSNQLQLDGQIIDVEKEDGGREPNAGGSGPGGEHMRFAARLIASTEGGKVSPGPDGSLRVSGATSATILITAATDYNVAKLNFDRGIDPAAIADSTLAKAAATPWQQLRDEHIRDHRSLYDRFQLELDVPPVNLPADRRRLAMIEGGSDEGLLVLMANYGRYLLLGSSRAPGRLPANLQGIWNKDQWAAWEADYHLNVNLQMNYWPAPVTGLPETIQPLIDWFTPLTERGKMAARDMYGAEGWVCFHATNPFGRVSPSGSNASSQFKNGVLDPLAGTWLAAQLFDAWRFNPDKESLEAIYPILAGASEFVLDTLVECPDGMLRVVPSTSPENSYVLPDDGGTYRITAGSTYHMTIVREIFIATTRAAAILDTGAELRQRIAEAAMKLQPIEIGSDGRILEWSEPYKEAEPGHRHVSHLVGLHPFDQITRDTPELFDAARKTIETRLAHGGAKTGWSRAWTISFFARLGDGDAARHHANELIRRSTTPNLFDLHPPFQIDGNFGHTAGICEMLIQSHCRDENDNVVIDLLPALPAAWPDGKVKGLRTRGGCSVDIRWRNGRLESTVITADYDATVTIRYRGATRKLDLKRNDEITLNGPTLEPGS